MRILGIETSCDETAISIIEASGNFGANFTFKILGDMTLSQASQHAEFGGVYPSLAKREHAKNFTPILEQVLADASLLQNGAFEISEVAQASLRELLSREPELFEALVAFLSTHKRPQLDALAVTAGPGLEPALWVGINAARALSQIWDIPLVAANHMEGHIAISAMDGEKFGPLAFPAIALLISGGHTEIISMPEWMRYGKIGETRDDAVGEAFDKVARLLSVPYPGGPEISRLAAEHRAMRAPDTIQFPRPMIGSGDLDFSFSGLKTSVRTYVEKHPITSTANKHAIARAFEDAVTDVLVAKVRAALEQTGAMSLVVGGGVSANTYIRVALATLLRNEFPGTALLLPPLTRATDNALMIALAGYFHALEGDYANLDGIHAEGTKQLS